jgi:hypothetical protein
MFWTPYFEGDLDAIIFVASLAAYDQKLQKDEDENETNRMKDALDLFKSICNNSLLKNASIILLLNKLDIFEKKIQSTPIARHFPEYEQEKRGKNGGLITLR